MITRPRCSSDLHSARWSHEVAEFRRHSTDTPELGPRGRAFVVDVLGLVHCQSEQPLCVVQDPTRLPASSTSSSSGPTAKASRGSDESLALRRVDAGRRITRTVSRTASRAAPAGSPGFAVPRIRDRPEHDRHARLRSIERRRSRARDRRVAIAEPVTVLTELSSLELALVVAAILFGATGLGIWIGRVLSPAQERAQGTARDHAGRARRSRRAAARLRSDDGGRAVRGQARRSRAGSERDRHHLPPRPDARRTDANRVARAAETLRRRPHRAVGVGARLGTVRGRVERRRSRSRTACGRSPATP